MAGPTASVLFPQPISDEQVLGVIEKVFHPTPLPTEHSFVGQNGTILDCWVEGEPFFFTHGEDYPGRWAATEEGGFSRVIGWKLQDEVGIAAMCNGSVDHMLLARFCVTLAEEFGGIVDFGGCPGNVESGKAIIEMAGRLPGSLHCVPAFEEGARLNHDDFYCDAEFLRAWMSHPQFRMVK